MSRDEVSRERFGEVRSMLQRGPGEDHRAWSDTLWAMLETEQAQDPQGYAAKWVPYLAGFRERWARPLRLLGSYAELAHAREVAPFAVFDVRLASPHVGQEDVVEVLRSPHLEAARSLRLTNIDLDEEGSRVWMNARRPASLEVVELRTVRFWGVALEEVARSPLFEGLRALEWAGDRLVADTIAALMRPEVTARLEALRLPRTGMDARAFAHLAGASAPALRRLDVSVNGLDAAAMEALAGASWVGGLEVLECAQNPLGREGARALGRALDGVRLEVLDLEGVAPRLFADDVRALVERDGVEALRELSFKDVALGTEGAAVLAECDRLTGLEELVLCWCEIGDRAAEALAGAAHLRSLRRLVLWGNAWLGKKGHAALAESPYVGRLFKKYKK